jgi:hypothetical protein
MPELIPNADELIDQAVYDLWLEKVALDPLAAAASMPPKSHPRRTGNFSNSRFRWKNLNQFPSLNHF